jgi:hyperosmotically inducible periplasmic protein
MSPRITTAAFLVTMACAISLPANCAFAQDTTETPNVSKATIRKANARLEHSVRGALYKGKVDSANVRIVAKGGKVSLSGTVPDAGQVGSAGTIAAGVDGVSGVNNLLAVGVPGH